MPLYKKVKMDLSEKVYNLLEEFAGESGRTMSNELSQIIVNYGWVRNLYKEGACLCTDRDGKIRKVIL